MVSGRKRGCEEIHHYLIVVRWQLLQELSHSVPFSHTVHVGHFVLGNLRKVQMDLGKERKREEINIYFLFKGNEWEKKELFGIKIFSQSLSPVICLSFPRSLYEGR